MTPMPTPSPSPWWTYQRWVSPLQKSPSPSPWWTYQRWVIFKKHHHLHHDELIRGGYFAIRDKSPANLITLSALWLMKLSEDRGELKPNPSTSPLWIYQRWLLSQHHPIQDGFIKDDFKLVPSPSEVISFRQKVLEIHKLQIFFSLGDIVNSGIGLSYRPASLCSLAGR